MKENSIPKIIHYCWFGRSPLPELAKKCIASWRKYFPDYEIKEWNEDNFDVNSILYTSQAYQAKKYAFVSDYARFWILYMYGGLYFDTDVEVIRPMDDIIQRGPFMGCEKPYKEGATPKDLGVAPGLGLFREILDEYERLGFYKADGELNLTTIVEYTTNILYKHGMKNTSEIQEVSGIYIYPQEYFAPKDVDTKKLKITKKTRSIHHYDASWAEWYDKAAGERGPKLKKIFGDSIGQSINISIYVIQKYGFIGCLKKILK